MPGYGVQLPVSGVRRRGHRKHKHRANGGQRQSDDDSGSELIPQNLRPCKHVIVTIVDGVSFKDTIFQRIVSILFLVKMISMVMNRIHCFQRWQNWSTLMKNWSGVQLLGMFLQKILFKKSHNFAFLIFKLD